MYFGLPNKRTDPNKHTGLKIESKWINAQTWIIAQGITTLIMYRVFKWVEIYIFAEELSETILMPILIPWKEITIVGLQKY